MLWIAVFWKILRSYLGLLQNSSAMVVGRGECGLYTLCLFTFYVLALEDKKWFPTQNHLFPNLLATLARNDVILLRTLAACAVWPIQSELSEGF